MYAIGTAKTRVQERIQCEFMIAASSNLLRYSIILSCATPSLLAARSHRSTWLRLGVDTVGVVCRRSRTIARSLRHSDYKYSRLALSMPSIPVDVLWLILEQADKSSLAKICLLNKICCSCSQDILYRNIRIEKPSDNRVYQTLAQSTHLANRVRSFEITYLTSVVQCGQYLEKSLQSMKCLRILRLIDYTPIYGVLEGCTFKLVEFACVHLTWKPLYQFLLSQPGLTVLELKRLRYYDSREFEATFLPNVTRITAHFNFLRHIIPYRPVNEVTCTGPVYGSVDPSFFKLSAAPIKKLTIDCSCLYPIPGQHLTSIFPSLTHLDIVFDEPNRFSENKVREPHFYLFNDWITNK